MHMQMYAISVIGYYRAEPNRIKQIAGYGFARSQYEMEGLALNYYTENYPQLFNISVVACVLPQNDIITAYN